jgi:hypothetical protein
MSARAALAAALAAACLAAAGCGDRHSWRPDEAGIVGWWLEDIAHGSPRRVGEVELEGASEMQATFVSWARGSEVLGVHTWPTLLQARLQRHAALASLAASHLLVRTVDGMLAPAPGLDLQTRAIAAQLVDLEDRDRRELDASVIALCDAQPAAAEAYLAAIRRARAALDQAMGVALWTGAVRGEIERAHDS